MTPALAERSAKPYSIIRNNFNRDSYCTYIEFTRCIIYRSVVSTYTYTVVSVDLRVVSRGRMSAIRSRTRARAGKDGVHNAALILHFFTDRSRVFLRCSFLRPQTFFTFLFSELLFYGSLIKLKLFPFNKHFKLEIRDLRTRSSKFFACSQLPVDSPHERGQAVFR